MLFPLINTNISKMKNIIHQSLFNERSKSLNIMCAISINDPDEIMPHLEI
jgi:hypothetical protein